MCYSASASFAASGALAASGYAISRTSKKKSEIPLSLLPIIFAVHQFIEGVLWLNHDNILPGTVKLGAVYSYLFIAFALWPVYLPFSIYLIETHRMRRGIIFLCQFIGFYVSLTSLISIIRYPVDISVVCHHFSYVIDTPESILMPYLISVSIPFIISSNKKLIIFGGALTLSCIAAVFLATSTTFPSVWCFFAAILSLSLYLYFRTSTESEHQNQPIMRKVTWESG